MYVCMYTHTHTHTYMCVYICICVYVSIFYIQYYLVLLSLCTIVVRQSNILQCFPPIFPLPTWHCTYLVQYH